MRGVFQRMAVVSGGGKRQTAFTGRRGKRLPEEKGWTEDDASNSMPDERQPWNSTRAEDGGGRHFGRGKRDGTEDALVRVSICRFHIMRF